MSKKPVGCMAEAEQEAMLALLPPEEAAIFRQALAASAANAEADAAAAAAREKLFALLSPEQAVSTRKALAGTGGTRGASKPVQSGYTKQSSARIADKAATSPSVHARINAMKVGVAYTIPSWLEICIAAGYPYKSKTAGDQDDAILTQWSKWTTQGLVVDRIAKTLTRTA
ncbi:MAG: hypothetical protein WCP20_07935 [Desulfuromonadales bacterium]